MKAFVQSKMTLVLAGIYLEKDIGMWALICSFEDHRSREPFNVRARNRTQVIYTRLTVLTVTKHISQVPLHYIYTPYILARKKNVLEQEVKVV